METFAAALRIGPLALGFEAPMFVPIRTDPKRLTAARTGEFGKGLPSRRDSNTRRETYRESGSSTFSRSGHQVIMRGIRSHRDQSSRITGIDLSVFLYCAAKHEILEFLIGAQSQHLLASVCSLSSSEILMHDVGELFELL